MIVTCFNGSLSLLFCPCSYSRCNDPFNPDKICNMLCLLKYNDDNDDTNKIQCLFMTK